MSYGTERLKERDREAALRLPQHLLASSESMCDWPGCRNTAQYPAPRSRDKLRDFRYLCLEHVRIVNASWDYFKGMSQAEIEDHCRKDATWHRPTWRVGCSAGFDSSEWRDWFDLFRFGPSQTHVENDRANGSVASDMMTRLGLDVGFTLVELKKRYKTLVKRHHPDLHGGDKKAEERLKLINEAYTYLLERRIYC